MHFAGITFTQDFKCGVFPCGIDCGIATFTSKDHNNCFILWKSAAHLISWIIPVGYMCTNPPPSRTSSELLTIDQSCRRSPSQCLMLVSEQLACLHQWVHSRNVANLTPFSHSPFPLSILLLPIKHIPSPFSSEFDCLTHITGGVTGFYSSYTNSLYLPVKGYCWEVGNGCVRLSLSSPRLPVCVCV